MSSGKLPIIGETLKDVNRTLNKLAERQATKPIIHEYTAAIGDNSVRHNQKGVPSGRHIVWSEVGNLLDLNLTATHWTFSATVAGTVKVIWL